MKILHSIVLTTTLSGGISGVAQSADPPSDPAAYKQKLHDCQTQMKADHSEMNHDARRKACRKQLGAMPKAPTAAPAATPPPSP